MARKNVYSQVYVIRILEISENYRVPRVQEAVERLLVFSSWRFSLEYFLPKATWSSQMQVALLLLWSFFIHCHAWSLGPSPWFPKFWWSLFVGLQCGPGTKLERICHSSVFPGSKENLILSSWSAATTTPSPRSTYSVV